MRTSDAWFPRYALRNKLMFFCRLFSPAVGEGSSALSTFLTCCMQRVNFFHHTVKSHIKETALKKLFSNFLKA